MVNITKFDTLFSMMRYFNTEEKCRQAIIDARWADGDIVCPKCGHHHCVLRSDGKYRCTKCGSNFSCLVGTIFENTKVKLSKWFIAMYLISNNRKGISSAQLARDIEVTQSTAWYMLHKIRTLFAQDDATTFGGEVECDEVYIGGREKWKHKSMRTPNTQGRSTKTKTPVFGMIERRTIKNKKGEEEAFSVVRAMMVDKTDSSTLMPIIKKFVRKGSNVITDELSSYSALSGEGYLHSVVCHGAEEYSNGCIFTNNMEGFWALFRRMIHGIYHDVSDKHLQRYVDEACFRWNTRKMDESERFAHMFRMSIGIVRYSDVRMEKVA